MKEGLKNTVIGLYKSGIHENIHLADSIMDSQKHIPIRQLRAIDAAIHEGSGWYSRHFGRYMRCIHDSKLSYDRTKTSIKYINK